MEGKRTPPSRLLRWLGRGLPSRLSSSTPRRDHLVEEYRHLAPEYETKWSLYVEVTTRETLARLSLRPGSRLLDVGCGTGFLLHRLSQTAPDARLSGVDPVPAMLSVARRRLSPDIQLQAAWVEHLPFESGTVDVVLSCNMFHYVRDPAAALREIMRVLAPGGRLVLTDWCDDYLACRICDLYLRLFNRAHVKMYNRGECLRLLHDAGFKAAAINRYKISWLWGMMTATAWRQEEPPPRGQLPVDS